MCLWRAQLVLGLAVIAMKCSKERERTNYGLSIFLKSFTDKERKSKKNMAWSIPSTTNLHKERWYSGKRWIITSESMLFWLLISEKLGTFVPETWTLAFQLSQKSCIYIIYISALWEAWGSKNRKRCCLWQGLSTGLLLGCLWWDKYFLSSDCCSPCLKQNMSSVCMGFLFCCLELWVVAFSF